MVLSITAPERIGTRLFNQPRRIHGFFNSFGVGITRFGGKYEVVFVPSQVKELLYDTYLRVTGQYDKYYQDKVDKVKDALMSIPTAVIFYREGDSD